MCIFWASGTDQRSRGVKTIIKTTALQSLFKVVSLVHTNIELVCQIFFDNVAVNLDVHSSKLCYSVHFCLPRNDLITKEIYVKKFCVFLKKSALALLRRLFSYERRF